MDNLGLFLRKACRPRPQRILILLGYNLIATLLSFIVLGVGLSHWIPKINYTDALVFWYPGIISFWGIIFAWGIAGERTYQVVHATRTISQIRISPLSTSTIYFGELLSFGLEALAHVLLSSLVLLILIGGQLNFFFLLQFWVYMALIIYIFVQAGIIAGIKLPRRESFFMLSIALIAPLLLISGVLFPTHIYTGVWDNLFYYFPLTVMVEGARELLVYHSYNFIYLIYIFLLDGLVTLLCYFLFKKSLHA